MPPVPVSVESPPPAGGRSSPPSTPGAPRVPDDHTALLGRDLLVPVVGVERAKLQDNYSARRGDRIHAAIDIMAPRGTPVVAVSAGVLWKVRSNTLGGRTVYLLDDEQRFVYYYAHLDRYAAETVEGRRVERGAVLGYVGTTGNAPPDVPHLHFQLMKYRGDGRWWDGEPINPYPYLSGTARGQR